VPAFLKQPLLATLIVPAALVAGCAGTVIDSQKAEDAIADNVETATRVQVETVSCPDDVEVEAGARFDCEVTTSDGRRAVAELKILNQDADVRVTRLRGQ
jgi:hypothetical protein